jgi:hypothetical protein
MLADAADSGGTSTRITIGLPPGTELARGLGPELGGNDSRSSSSAGGSMAESPAAKASTGGARVARSYPGTILGAGGKSIRGSALMLTSLP